MINVDNKIYSIGGGTPRYCEFQSCEMYEEEIGWTPLAQLNEEMTCPTAVNVSNFIFACGRL
jgi:hypothetical protein